MNWFAAGDAKEGGEGGEKDLVKTIKEFKELKEWSASASLRLSKQDEEEQFYKNEIAEKDRKIKVLEKMIDDMTEKNLVLKGVDKKLQDTEAEVNQCKEENKSLRCKVQDQQTMIATKNDLLSKLQTEADAVDIVAIETAREQAENDFGDILEKYEQLEIDYQEERDRSARLQAEMGGFNAIIAEKDKSMVQAMTTAAEAKEKMDGQVAQLEALEDMKEKFNAMQEELLKANATNEALGQRQLEQEALLGSWYCRNCAKSLDEI